MSDRTLAIRLAVKDGEVVRRALMQLGEDGSKALSRIEQAAKPASKGLLAINEVTSAARVHLEGFAGHLGGVGSVLLRLGPAGLAAGAALGGLAAALGQGLREMETAQQSLLRLEAVLKATGHASGLTGQELNDLADAMEASTMVTAKGVMDASSVLATFRSVSGDTFIRAIKAAQDLSAVFGQDLRSSAVQLGKALEDPVEGVTALKRVGVTFSAAQREMIAAMVEAGDVAGAQVVILETLERQVGGAGEAEAGGLTGAVHHLKAAWGNLLEDLARTPAVGGVVQATLRGLTSFVNDLREGFKGPDIASQVATRVQQLADLEKRIAEFQAAGAPQRRLDELRHQAQVLNREIDALIDKGHAEVAALDTGRDEAESGRKEAERERYAETIAARLKALEAEKVKAAVDAAEKIAAVDDQLARDIATAESRRGRAGIEEADIEREIALLRDIAARKVEAIEKPLHEAALRTDAQARKVIADLERQLGGLTDPRGAAIDLALSRLPEGATETQRREVERLSGALDQDTYARAVEEAERKKLEASREWRDGAIRAIRSYVDEASDGARAAEQATTRSLQAGEEAFVKWATTGKLAAGDLFNSIAEEALRAAWRLSVAKPLGGILEGLFSAIGEGMSGWFGGGGGETPAPPEILEAHGGGIVGHDPLRRRAVDPAVFREEERFHGGGLVGLRHGEVPIVALRGEEVLTRDDPRHRFNLAGGQGAVTVVVQPTVTNSVPNTQARTETRRGPAGEVMIDVFVEQMEMLMSRRIGRGEGLAPTLERRYGLNRAAGAHR